MSTASKSAVDHAAYKRRVNEWIHECLRSRLPTEPIGFFCECPSPSCFATVRLTCADYDVGRRHPRWAVLAEGHGRSARGRASGGSAASSTSAR
jgi:hypothetical protein